MEAEISASRQKTREETAAKQAETAKKSVPRIEQARN
jgi:hypothetical protein